MGDSQPLPHTPSDLPSTAEVPAFLLHPHLRCLCQCELLPLQSCLVWERWSPSTTHPWERRQVARLILILPLLRSGSIQKRNDKWLDYRQAASPTYAPTLLGIPCWAISDNTRHFGEVQAGGPGHQPLRSIRRWSWKNEITLRNLEFWHDETVQVLE